MPTYEFKCTKGHITEEFYQRPSLKPITTFCSTCPDDDGGPEIAFPTICNEGGFVTKGSGFYGRGKV